LKEKETELRNNLHIKAACLEDVDFRDRKVELDQYPETEKCIIRKAANDAIAGRYQGCINVNSFEKKHGVKHKKHVMYQDMKCVRCNYEVEDSPHIIQECVQTRPVIQVRDVAMAIALEPTGIDMNQLPWLTENESLGPYSSRDPERPRGLKKGAKPGPAAKRKRANAAWIHRKKYMGSLGFLPKSFVEKLYGLGSRTSQYLTQKITKILLDCVIEAYKKHNQEFKIFAKGMLSRDGPVGHIT